MTATALERCANCEETIGRLEPAHVWDGQVVCARCYRKLRGEGVAPAPAHAPAPAPAAPPPARALDDRVVYSDAVITVTRSRILYGLEVLPLANVSFVNLLTVPPDRGRYLWATVGGALFALVGCLPLTGNAAAQLFGAIVILGGLALLGGGDLRDQPAEDLLRPERRHPRRPAPHQPPSGQAVHREARRRRERSDGRRVNQQNRKAPHGAAG